MIINIIYQENKQKDKGIIMWDRVMVSMEFKVKVLRGVEIGLWLAKQVDQVFIQRLQFQLGNR
jgi:hypothetical protein